MPALTSFRDSSHFYVRTTFMSLRTSSNLRIAVDGLCISSNNYKGECCFIKPSYSFLDLPIIRIKIKTDFPSQAKQWKYPHNHPSLFKKINSKQFKPIWLTTGGLRSVNSIFVQKWPWCSKAILKYSHFDHIFIPITDWFKLQTCCKQQRWTEMGQSPWPKVCKPSLTFSEF